MLFIDFVQLQPQKSAVISGIFRRKHHHVLVSLIFRPQTMIDLVDTAQRVSMAAKWLSFFSSVVCDHFTTDSFESRTD